MKIRLPHPLLLLLGGVATAALLTWVLPAGEYERRENPETGASVAVAGTYREVEAAPVGVFRALVAVPRGFVAGAEVILTILITGGAFGFLDSTGALRRLIGALVGRTRRPRLVVVALCITFALLGAAEQMHEEFIALMPVLVVLAGGLGFGAVTALAMSMGAAVVGAAFGQTNPFGPAAALKAAELPPLSEAPLRLAVFAAALAVWIAWTLSQTKRDDVRVEAVTEKLDPPTTRDALSLTVLLIPIAAYVVGVLAWGWGINELSALMLLGGFLVGVLQRHSLNDTTFGFIKAMEGMVGAALLVGVARGIGIVLADGRVIDTIIAGIVTPLESMPAIATAVLMIPAQAAMHIPVSSTSGLAMMTMPIMAPLADLLGLSRDAAVLAYQAGGVLTEMVNPTNGALFAMLLNSKVSYGRWLRFAIPAILMIWGVTIIGLVLL